MAFLLVGGYSLWKKRCFPHQPPPEAAAPAEQLAQDPAGGKAVVV